MVWFYSCRSFVALLTYVTRDCVECQPMKLEIRSVLFFISKINKRKSKGYSIPITKGKNVRDEILKRSIN